MENKLTIKELAPYLPYGIEIHKRDCAFPRHTFTLCSDGLAQMESEGFELFHPILRQLSDLTSEIKHNGEKFVPSELLNEEIPNSPNYDWLKDTYTKKDLSHSIIEWCVMDKLISWHFDVFGLIERGLALPIKN